MNELAIAIEVEMKPKKKCIMLGEQTHYLLTIFKVHSRCKSYQEAIEQLLREQGVV